MKNPSLFPNETAAKTGGNSLPSPEGARRVAIAGESVQLLANQAYSFDLRVRLA